MNKPSGLKVICESAANPFRLLATSALYFLCGLCVQKEHAFHAEVAKFFRKARKGKALRAFILRQICVNMREYYYFQLRIILPGSK
jgi:hypothetical protein